MSGGNVGGGFQVKLKGDIISLPVAAAVKIYRGTLVAFDATGGLVQASNTAGQKFAGVAEETVDNTVGTAALGTLSCRVRRNGLHRLKKNSVNASTDVGAVIYAKTAQTATVDQDVEVAAAASARIPIGICTAVEATIGTSHYIWVSIQPNVGTLLNTSDIATHAALADQTAHLWSGLTPEVNTETVTTPTITAAEFIKGINLCTYAGTVTFTLPTSGILAGTTTRFVKGSSTVGLFTITGGTLTGPQTASNVFYGASNDGDSVTIMCVSDNVYKVVSVSQRPTALSKTATATLTAAEVARQPIIDAAHATVAIALTLPAAAAANAGTNVYVGAGDAAAVTLICTAGFGGGGSGKDTYTLAQGDMVHVVSDGTNWYGVNTTLPA